MGVPIVRIIVYWGLYWGPPILGNYHLEACLTAIRFGAILCEVHVKALQGALWELVYQALQASKNHPTKPSGHPEP